ncbi:GGDEF domain-containing protein [Salinispirillum sp. LH 10-3-1]|uniref:diguanylate cyclase n=1 Tax=Salinispirillum sp. LH 10-3-1 TaxID=2952525 RepID=A0AB38YJ34_9GAMM
MTLVFRALVTSILAMAMACSVYAQHPISTIIKQPSVDLSTEWQYRWGDSPLDSQGLPLWITEPDETAWRPIDFPSNPPGRQGRTNAWFKAQLPDNQWRDPALYIYSIDLIAEFYLDNELIYRYGTFDENGQGRFIGWPWHIILLPEDFAGRTLYVRTYSDYPDIGLWGEIILGPHIVHLQRMVKADASSLFIGAMLILVGLFSGIFWLANRSMLTNLYLSMFAFCLAAVVLHQAQLKQLLFFAPLRWEIVGALAYCALVIPLAGYVEQFSGRGWRHSLVILKWGVTALVAVSALLSITDVVSIANLYPVFDVTLVISLLIIAAHVVHSIVQGNVQARVVFAGLCILGGFWFYDMATAHGFLPWDRQRTEWGALIFVLILSVLSFRVFINLQRQLIDLTQILEAKVTERTIELARRNDDLSHANQQLHSLATTDPLTELYNRRHFFDCVAVEIKRTRRTNMPLSMLVMDADNFKDINDTYGHATGDRVLQDAASICRSVVRDTDIFGRIGGEEFAVCLPETDELGAKGLAERVLNALRSTPIHFQDNTINLTMSIGIATLAVTDHDVDTLYQRADAAMYDAKHHGRDGIAIR